MTRLANHATRLLNSGVATLWIPIVQFSGHPRVGPGRQARTTFLKGITSSCQSVSGRQISSTGWRLHKRLYWPQPAHHECARWLTHEKRGTRNLLTGNHD